MRGVGHDHTAGFNRTVIGIGLTSFLSDLCHEMATALLPVFLVSLGASAAVLGVIEGVSDALSSFAKWPGGWFADRTGIRKPIGMIGYGLTTLAIGSFAWARSWVDVLVGRTIAWIGRGIRTPVRDTLMAESVEPSWYGRAFGFERTLDTLGAIAGPLVALWLVRWIPIRRIFLITLIPGLLAVVTFGLAVCAKRAIPNRSLTLHGSWKGLPATFKRYLVAVGVFGFGDFAHTLLVLHAVQLLTPHWGAAYAGAMGVGLYGLHNMAYAVSCLASGYLADAKDKGRVLAVGYLSSAVMCIGFLMPIVTPWYLGILFIIGGAFVGVEETLEKAVAADLLPAQLRGSGFGILATVNGVGDFASSVIVGLLWQAFHPSLGFLLSGILSVIGAWLILAIVGTDRVFSLRLKDKGTPT